MMGVGSLAAVWDVGSLVGVRSLVGAGSLAGAGSLVLGHWWCWCWVLDGCWVTGECWVHLQVTRVLPPSIATTWPLHSSLNFLPIWWSNARINIKGGQVRVQKSYVLVVETIMFDPMSIWREN